LTQTLPARTLPTQSARRSDAIAIARVICIMGVIYVHAWTGRGGEDLIALRNSTQEGFRWVLMEVFGHSAVPLLGLISGWLVGGSSLTRDFTRHVARKAKTILLPMVLWNALAILLVSGTAMIGTLAAPQPHSAGWILQELFIVSRNPDINVQMPFLRDLFLCMLLAPALVRMPAWALWLVAAAALVAQIAGFGPPVFMRPSILFFFVLGMLARRGDAAERVAALPWIVAVGPFAALMAVHLVLSMRGVEGLGIAILDMTMRVAAAFCFWRVAWGLADSPARGALLRIEPYVFLIFCAHLILIWLGGPVLGALFGRLGQPFYPAYLVVQPLLVLIAVVMLGEGLRALAPQTAKLLSGGRLKAA
jgi:hypothetical protein